MNLIDQIFAVSSAIRYVALYRGGSLSSAVKEDLNAASSSESDKYEELLVNPTLLKLARQRGEIDCGGMRYILIRYGNFYQLVIDLPDGHVSICFALESNPLSSVDEIAQLCLLK
ncbi:MAG: hypothetical protein H0W65_05040 [Sphingomonas sp.]|uniref:hypothetical protein n=1 Tax=Sphingomonas sp. TaxID=28214 RepID=UPI0017A4C8F4|nr:hypothetical protein [Sphingomonas sp.]MBA3667070.1 hypothetical protein [Sphingomonas sp.]